ncbi:unnamed protein product [Brassica rapa]|uniref:Uncharacterized protein n=2 Tax=Brassica TaxID=3705 RepID=A0A3P6B454_BRACM|nr:unnamed protein product [Brassica napus]CAG7894878.1 unnamed protein product [Brassica rapa]CDY37176.1 BnaA02g24950D [Brassica napus]CDY62683.1 BnaCnng40840D [Brassica napus]VDC90968.1 unnamed protein product [Brassica rapa]
MSQTWFHNPLVELFIVASAPSGGIRAASLWFFNRRTIMDVMLISSCNLYLFVDESSLVEREYHEICREIYGDPIYDVYEDDEIHKEICGDPIYDVYEENDFDNLVRAKIGRNLVYAEDFKHNQALAIYVQKQFYEEFGSCKICANSTCEDFVQHPMWKNRLKIRGRNYPNIFIIH